jgi:imidazolonepropionase-like amidohydrolase
MGFLNSLGLHRPAPPRCAAQGRFDIAGVAVINPARDRREGATIDIADGAISGISEQAADASSEFSGCFALPGLIDMHVHLPPDNRGGWTRSSRPP